MSATPTPYNVTTDFSDHSDNFPTTPHSGADIDVELANIETALDETQARLLEIQNDDGSVQNASIGLDQLKTEVSNRLTGAGSDSVTNDSTVSGASVSDALETVKAVADAALPKAGGALTGAVTTTSTFDGRDVASDGAKLDGIEALADVTDATNVASAGAHMSGGTDVPVTDGGTGASTASAARTNLGLAIGSDVQAHDSVLDSTTASYTTAEETKLAGIEASADVTDETNVTSALSGATLTDVGTPASTDKILLQDASDSDNLKYADFSEFGGGGGGLTQDATLDDTTGNEVSLDLSYTVNKATSGNDTGLKINKTDTASPGTSNLIDAQRGGTSQFSVSDYGYVDLAGSIEAGVSITAVVGDIVASGGDLKAEAGEVLSSAFKKAPNTPNRALYLNGTGYVTESATTSTELGYVSGVTSAIQTQLDAKSSDSHAGAHVTGGADEIDGDQLDIDYTAGNYTPATTGVSPNVAHLSSHLNGIDNEIAVHASDIYTNSMDISDHTSDTYNPHAVTKAQVGLGNVENTALSTWAGTSYITTLGALAAGVTLDEIAAPSTPATGKVVVYPKTDGKLYLKDDAGTETDLTASGGGGGGGPAEVVLDSGEFYGLVTNGASPGFRELATNDVALPTLNFDDVTQEYAECRWFVPSNWDGNDIPVELEWTTAADPTGTGDDGVRWEVSVLILANDDEIDAAFSTAVAVSDTATATTGADRLYRSASFNLDAADLTADRRCIIRLSRVPSHGDDDMTGDAEFIAMILTPGYS